MVIKKPTICKQHEKNFRYCTEKCDDIEERTEGNNDIYWCKYFKCEVIPHELDLTPGYGQ